MQLFQLIHKPFYQSLIFILFTILVTIIIKPKTADHLWVICGCIYGLFMLTNAVLAFSAVDIWSYFFISLGISILYLCMTAVTVNMLMHILKLTGSQESAMIFMVVIFHPIVLLMAVFLKWAVS